uniref:AlNc14C110G6356 protein n=1 Tax=Albugo laibachii Nc14 TaxID=890382 RepID=F0WIF6_9STRA|nr:AlNc14C110G6356 [Albugo laibachii Nc14]|eukprot:CCA21038.1 AlNc14C110G6356 [Albugo laibachii Nc14]
MTTNADDYAHEMHSSADERRSSGSDLDDQDSNADDFFFRRTYTCNSDVVVACSEYNAKAGRVYVVKSSACVSMECEFVVKFAFGREFRPPTEFRRHTCDPTKVDNASYDARRALKPQFLSRNKFSRQFGVDNGRKASPRALQDLLSSSGLDVNYHTCTDACAIGESKLFQSDRLQFQLILSYIHEMNKCRHRADIDFDGTAIRLVDGRNVYEALFGRYTLGCVFIEEQQRDPDSRRRVAFFISDRDKGLIPALKQVDARNSTFFSVCVISWKTLTTSSATRPSEMLGGSLERPSLSLSTKRADELAKLNQRRLSGWKLVTRQIGRLLTVYVLALVR